MNRQNFEAADRFPLSTQALTFMQEMIFATAKLALIGGDNYILSGCTTSGNTVSDGVIVIAGEPMPFKGGTSTATITIVEETIPVSANGLTFDKARTKRHAKFATGTGANYLPWADFKPLATNKQLEEVKATVKYVDDAIAKIQGGQFFPGMVIMWSGSINEIPEGWMLCDYSLIPGAGGKRTPDLRGKFVVGYNLDNPDYNEVGKIGGNKEIKLSPDNIPAHDHLNGIATTDYGDKIAQVYAKTSEGMPGIANAIVDMAMKTAYIQGRTSKTGKSTAFDIRPPYYVLAFIIKI